MLAVTTRNKLRSWRYCVPMMRARGYVREQLVTTPGLIRYVSAIASPTEFLTMTVWENQQAMFNFMSSGAHQEFMWMFSRWSASFWSMRWIPTDAEDGAWDGHSLRNLMEPDEQHRRDARPQVPPLPLPEQQQGRMSGGRLADPSSCDVYAIMALVEESSPAHYWKLLKILQEFRRKADHTQLLRWNVAAIGPRSFWILTLWRNASGRPTDVVQIFRQRLGASWTMCWEAGEYEIGNWNGLRLRRLASARSRQQRMADKTGEQAEPGLS
ncbi:MAG: antibiotic biosynthesis monooxygenase [Ktedonobacteraceae bacterium]